MYLSQLAGLLPFSPFKILGIIYGYKGFISQLVKIICLSEIIAGAPFPSTESQGLLPLPPVLLPLVMFRTPGNFSKIVTEAPFLSPVSRTLPSFCAMLLVILGTPGNLTKPSSGLQS